MISLTRRALLMSVSVIATSAALAKRLTTGIGGGQTGNFTDDLGETNWTDDKGLTTLWTDDFGH